MGRVLIVEDEALIAFDLADIISNMGLSPVGPAMTLGKGLELAEEELDFALLDVNLGKDMSLPIAHRLREREIRFAVLSGYAPESLRDYGDCPLIAKPVSADAVRQTVRNGMEVS